MFNKLKVIALDIVIKELELFLRDRNATIKTNEYFGKDNVYHEGVAAGIRTAINIANGVKVKFTDK